MNHDINKLILHELKRNTPGYVSGEALSETIGVSRTAIWKHIKELKDTGYGIESSSRKGYSLIEYPDVLNAYEIAYGMETKLLGKETVYFDVIDSTNTYAKRLAGEGCTDGTLVVADIQTAGRGRLGREWDSAGGKGIWMSVVFRPSILPEDVQIITLAASVAVVEALRAVCGLKAGIKWPNDILIDGKKVCGILTEINAEMERVNYVVLGIGINVNHEVEDFGDNLRGLATSLKVNSGQKDCRVFKRSEIIKKVLVELERIYFGINSIHTYNKALADIIRLWKKYSITLGKRVRVTFRGSEFTGTAIDITDDGKLVIDCDDGMRREVISGEVSVRGLLGYA
ncbi:MAG: biotin--[acetyl-CoA-carboxylase] ligase [Clostridia bacterium]|nr:biotin--[acetyl-CoA-carboxylase] ligase [Clostridia bacterium]